VPGRITQRLGSNATFAKVMKRVAPAGDKLFHKLTGGRWTPSSTQVPSLMLTTTGAKSGEPRTVPLACLPDGDGFFLVGSNFGQQHHPAWSGNLLKTPEATVVFRRRTIPVTARLLDDEEKAEVWPRLTEMWPSYDAYVDRSGRNIRVFHLTPR
jgi:deazaflavin-dependent oxidoreductase (nitroreductase family)